MAESLPNPISKFRAKLSNLPAVERTAILDRVLDGYRDGAQVEDMQAELGVSDTAIYSALLAERIDDWSDAQKARALARLERAMRQLEVAPDALGLARARERVRAAQWELERLLKRLYGTEQAQNTGQVAISIHITRTEPTQVVDIKADRVDE